MQKRFSRANEQRNRNDVFGLLPKLALHVDAARFVDPVQHALGVKRAGVAAEQHGGRVLAPVVADPGMAQFGDAVLDGLGYLERVAERAAGKGLNLETSAGELIHLFGKRFGADIHQRPAAPAGGHLPVVGGALRLYRRRSESGPGCACTQRCPGQKFSAFHARLLGFDFM